MWGEGLKPHLNADHQGRFSTLSAITWNGNDGFCAYLSSHNHNLGGTGNPVQWDSQRTGGPMSDDKRVEFLQSTTYKI